MQLLLEALTYHRGSDEPLSVVVILVVRATLALAAGWLASRAVSRSSAAVQHRVWLLAALGTLVVPLLWALTPHWRMPLLAVYVQATPGFAPAPVSAQSAWPELLVAVWITGALAGLAYMMLGIVLARRLFAASLPCRDGAWLAALALVKREMGLARRVELRIAPFPMSPAVWSFRRVRILVPADSMTWSLELRRNVLLHELAHVARRDCASHLLANLACAVWWFHPLVWYAAGRVRGLAEQAADDCVLRTGKHRADYAQGLLTIASSLGIARLPAVVQTMFQPSHLERRLRAILDPARRRNPLGGRLSIASTLIACAMMVLLATITSSSVVRAVPSPPHAEGQPSKARVDPNERLAALFIERRQETPSFVQVRALPLDPRQIVPAQSPFAPPQPIMQLIPNWQVGGHAEMLIPNYECATAQTILVEQHSPTPGGTTFATPHAAADPISAARTSAIVRLAAHSAAD